MMFFLGGSSLGNRKQLGPGLKFEWHGVALVVRLQFNLFGFPRKVVDLSNPPNITMELLA